MSKGYLLTTPEWNKQVMEAANGNKARWYFAPPYSSAGKTFRDNSKTIDAVMVIIPAISQINVPPQIKDKFEEVGDTAYINFPKESGGEIDSKDVAFRRALWRAMLSQFVVMIVANWEGYFNGITKDIFNDIASFQNGSDIKEALFYEMKKERIDMEIDDIKDNVFGDWLCSKDTILSFQNLDRFKDFFAKYISPDGIPLSKWYISDRLTPGVPLTQLDEATMEVLPNWHNYYKLFEARNLIIHHFGFLHEGVKQYKEEWKQYGPDHVLNHCEYHTICDTYEEMKRLVKSLEMRLFFQFPSHQ